MKNIYIILTSFALVFWYGSINAQTGCLLDSTTDACPSVEGATIVASDNGGGSTSFSGFTLSGYGCAGSAAGFVYGHPTFNPGADTDPNATFGFCNFDINGTQVCTNQGTGDPADNTADFPFTCDDIISFGTDDSEIDAINGLDGVPAIIAGFDVTLQLCPGVEYVIWHDYGVEDVTNGDGTCYTTTYGALSAPYGPITYTPPGVIDPIDATIANTGIAGLTCDAAGTATISLDWDNICAAAGIPYGGDFEIYLNGTSLDAGINTVGAPTVADSDECFTGLTGTIGIPVSCDDINDDGELIIRLDMVRMADGATASVNIDIAGDMAAVCDDCGCDVVAYTFGGAGFNECQNIQDGFDNICVTDPDVCAAFGGNPFPPGFPGFNAGQDPCTFCAATASALLPALPAGCVTNYFESYSFGNNAAIDPCNGVFDDQIPDNNDGFIFVPNYWDHPDADGCSPVYVTTMSHVEFGANCGGCEDECLSFDAVVVQLTNPDLVGYAANIVPGDCETAPSIEVFPTDAGGNQLTNPNTGDPVVCQTLLTTSEPLDIPACNESGLIDVLINLADPAREDALANAGLPEDTCADFFIQIPYDCQCCTAVVDYDTPSDVCFFETPLLTVGPDCVPGPDLGGVTQNTYDLYYWATFGGTPTSFASPVPPGGSGFPLADPNLLFIDDTFGPGCADLEGLPLAADLGAICEPLTIWAVIVPFDLTYDHDNDLVGGAYRDDCEAVWFSYTLWPIPDMIPPDLTMEPSECDANVMIPVDNCVMVPSSSCLGVTYEYDTDGDGIVDSTEPPVANCDGIVTTYGAIAYLADMPAALLGDPSICYNGILYDTQCVNDLTATVAPAVVQGMNGGVLPFWYNAVDVDICGGSGEYTWDWERSGYVRVDQENDYQNDDEYEFQIVYADEASWALTVTDENGCETIFTNDNAFEGGSNGTVNGGPLLDVCDADITGETSVNAVDGTITVCVEGGTPDYTIDLFDGSQVSVGTTSPLMTSSTLAAANDGTCSDCVTFTGLDSGHYTVLITDADGEETEDHYWVPLDRNGGRLKDGMSMNTMMNAYPNPFADATMIEFAVSEDTQVSMNVLDIAGRIVAKPYEGMVKAGQLERALFDAQDLANGVYICQLVTSTGEVSTHKLIVSK